jgi:hypothetical protein
VGKTIRRTSARSVGGTTREERGSVFFEPFFADTLQIAREKNRNAEKPIAMQYSATDFAKFCRENLRIEDGSPLKIEHGDCPITVEERS